VGFGLWERRGQREPAGPEIRKKNFRIKNWIFEFTKVWKFVEGNLGGILT
jgi:hypothetical protein